MTINNESKKKAKTNKAMFLWLNKNERTKRKKYQKRLHNNNQHKRKLTKTNNYK
jgi:hypothetical protein